MEDGKVIRDSQNGFIKGKLHLTHLAAFCNSVIASVNKRRAYTSAIHLHVCKAFDMIPNNILTLNLRDTGLMHKELAEWPCPNCYSQQLSVQAETSNEWYLSWVHTSTNII